MKYRLTAICLFAFILMSSQNIVSKPMEDPKQGWSIVKQDKSDEPSWIIYSRKIAGTNFLEYKIEGEVQLSPEACLASFKQDLHEQAAGKEKKKYPIYDIVEESAESLLTYVIHKEPFPLKNTEMSIRYTFFKHSDGSTEVSWHEAWEECRAEPSKKLSRVQTFRGSWHFTPTGDGTCQAVNSVQFDLKKMPLWLAEPMVLKFLKGGLKDIRKNTN